MSPHPDPPSPLLLSVRDCVVQVFFFCGLALEEAQRAQLGRFQHLINTLDAVVTVVDNADTLLDFSAPGLKG